MIEFWNVVIAFVVGLIGGAAIHSAWLHSKQRKEFGKEGDEGAGVRPDPKHTSLRTSVMPHE